MAASTFFHSDGEVDSMGFDPHSDLNDSPIEVEKELISTVDSKEKKLLVYPFIAGDLIETAAKGLLLGEDPITCSSAHLLQLQQEKAAQKNHFVTMLQEDIDRLQPDKWLNDCLIDFWMLWITRKEPSEENWIHIFNTQFYTSMVDNGVDHVLKWTEKKN